MIDLIDNVNQLPIDAGFDGRSIFDDFELALDFMVQWHFELVL